MARLVLFSQDRELSGDPVLDAARYDRGMVVDVLEDGQSLGKEGDTNPLFRVVEFPGASVEKLRFLLLGDAGDLQQEPKSAQVRRRRVQKLDLALTEELAADPITVEKIISQPESMEVHFTSAILSVLDLVNELPKESESPPGVKL